MRTVARACLAVPLLSTLSFAEGLPPQKGDLSFDVALSFVLDGEGGSGIDAANQPMDIYEIDQQEGERYHLSHVVAGGGTHRELATEPGRATLPSADCSEDSTKNEAAQWAFIRTRTVVLR